VGHAHPKSILALGDLKGARMVLPPRFCTDKESLQREPALRILCAKAAALGVERLWSAARITLTDNRRSIKTARLMQLLQLKLNIGLLEDSALLDSMCVKLVEDNFCAFESIFEDVVSFDEEERAAEAAQLVQEDTGIWNQRTMRGRGERRRRT
jgi:hypothetical protein